ncbi:sensor histidine kinase [Novosphingobium sp.]|uniref:sensor histidine kinase n=1 Tax=Novosphingobium sp. TaxID=1874826 RepID=UPI003566F57E
MSRRPSINRRLSLGLSITAILGTSLLLTAVFAEYRLGIRDLAGTDAFRFAWAEVADHVGMPVLLLIVPAILTVRIVIQRSYRLLENSARVISETPATRGLQIDDRAMPVEVLPFVSAINDLLKRLDHAAKEHESFAADVAHQIRTPLAIMALNLDHGANPDISVLRAEVASMSRLVEQLLLLTQVNAQAAAPAPLESHPLNDLVIDATSRFAPLAVAASRKVAFEECAADVAVACHKEAVASALRNLLDNALRITPEGGTVVVGCGPGKRIFVRDEGPGLPPDQLQTIITRQARTDSSQGKGAGLGLAIVTRIMAAHDRQLQTFPEKRELVMVFPD